MNDEYAFHTSGTTGARPLHETAPGGYMEPIRAAGTVLWRDGPGSKRIALVHRPLRDDWSLPKGKVKRHEHLLCTAVRETMEEAGVRAVLGRRLPPQRYLRDGWPKLVDWWVARAEGEDSFVPGDEVDAIEWCAPAEARERLTYGHDVQVLDNVFSGPLDTFPVVLLRHAPAGEKRSWRGDDLLRPLDADGRADAASLAAALSAFGAMRVVSSAAARCAETVLPYAARHGAEVRTSQAFTAFTADGATAIDTEAACAEFGRVLTGGVPTVVCTHGELVGTIVRDALTRLGAPITQQAGLRKGGFWVLHIPRGGSGLAAAERHTATG